MPPLATVRALSLVTLLAVGFQGCSPKTYILNQAGSVFENAGEQFQSENDPQLVREAFPFNLKTLDILAASSPDNRSILSVAASAYTMYTYAFILEDAERLIDDDYTAGMKEYKRAVNLFLRGKNYGIRSLALVYPEFESWYKLRPKESKFSGEDIYDLYWLAAATAGTISASQGNPKYLIELPSVGWLLEQALQIDSDWNNGALYTAMISYTMKRPDAPPEADKIAETYFDKAVERSNGTDCAPYLALAESVCIQKQQKERFVALLNQALAINVDDEISIRLTNVLAQDRARWLLSKVDELFY